MSLLKPAERTFLQGVANLGYCNHFLPERVQYEAAALGRDFVPGEPIWSASVAAPDLPRPNVVRIRERLERLLHSVRGRVAAAESIDQSEAAIYEECVQHLLYLRYYPQFLPANGNWKFYRDFAADLQWFFDLSGKNFETLVQAAHVFACFRQIQRAFAFIFDNIIGSSIPAARLRASIWQSIFTHDMRRYRRTMYARMPDFPTLITGPSGTGKELVARAIAGSRYVPFNVERLEFSDERNEIFLPINIAALSPTLIESELFGHRRGSFTGAVSDRKGWLETCPALGSVFLDELGEMDLSIQVKLLRVMETRRFSPVGDTAQRQFHGKLIAATNRDLCREILERRFREDLYYRLCADLIETPSLAEQIADSPEVLRELLYYMTRRAVGDEADQTLPEVESWIDNHLPKNYNWPGNYRELEQCVRNIVIRRSYRPMQDGRSESLTDHFFEDFRAGRLKVSQVIAYYAALVYRQTGSYEVTAKQLDLDRRTVKSKVQEYLSGSRQHDAEYLP
jgi:transcriptional regulator with AAA-type ATPase domain